MEMQEQYFRFSENSSPSLAHAEDLIIKKADDDSSDNKRHNTHENGNSETKETEKQTKA
jgi:hypothetical protein